MDEITSQKIDSLFEIFIWFLIVDWDIDEVEYEAMFDEFFIHVEKYFDKSKLNLSFNDAIIKIAEDEDNFARNAVFLNTIVSFDEKVAILVWISEVVLVDWDFSDKEYELFLKLMDTWNVTQDDLKK